MKIDVGELKASAIQYIIMNKSLEDSNPEIFKGECSKVVALAIVRKYFNDEWIKRFFFRRWASADKHDFLEQPYKYESFQRYCYSINRLVDFAECLMNLKDTAGFKTNLNRIISNTNGGDFAQFESGFAEFQAAKITLLSGMQFIFKVPQKVKGKDFDIEGNYLDGSPVAIEVKCLTNEQSLNENSFLTALKKAVNQSDESYKKIALIKVPESWAVLKEFDRIQLALLVSSKELYEDYFCKAEIGIFWESSRPDFNKNINMQFYTLANLKDVSQFWTYGLGANFNKLEKEVGYFKIYDLLNELLLPRIFIGRIL